MDNTSIYVAIDFDKNGSPCTITSHESLILAQDALNMRLQCDAENSEIEWETTYSSDELIDTSIYCYKPKHGSKYDKAGSIYKTVLNNRY